MMGYIGSYLQIVNPLAKAIIKMESVTENGIFYRNGGLESRRRVFGGLT
jgi:hypothetical protein